MDPSKADFRFPPLLCQIVTTTGGALLVCVLFRYAWYILGGLAFALGVIVTDCKVSDGGSELPHRKSLKYTFVIVGGSFSTWLVSNHPWYALTGAVSAATTSWWDFTMVHAVEFPSLFFSVGVGAHGYSQWLLLNYAWSRYLLFGIAVAALVVRLRDQNVDLLTRVTIAGGAAGIMWLLMHYSLSRYLLFGLVFTATVTWNHDKHVNLTSKSLITGTAAGILWVLLHFSVGWYFFLGFCLAMTIRAVTTTPDQAFWFIAGGGGAATLWLLVNDTWFFTFGLVIAAASALMTGFDEKDFPLYTFWVFTGIGSSSTWLLFNYWVPSFLWRILEGAWLCIFSTWTLYILLMILTSLSAMSNLKMSATAATIYGGGVSTSVYILVNIYWVRYIILGIIAAAYTCGAINESKEFPVSLFLLTAVGTGGIPWLLVQGHVSTILAVFLACVICIIVALHSFKKLPQSARVLSVGMSALLTFLIIYHSLSRGSSTATCYSFEKVGHLLTSETAVNCQGVQPLSESNEGEFYSMSIRDTCVKVINSIKVGIGKLSQLVLRQLLQLEAGNYPPQQSEKEVSHGW